MVTLTSVPWGWTESTVPTGTPSTRTVEPGYTTIASLKYAVTCMPLWLAWYTRTPPATSAAATMTAPAPSTSRSRRVRSRPPIRIVIIAGTSGFRGLAPGRGTRAGWQVGLGNDTAQVGVEPAAVAQGVAEQPVVGTGQRQRLLEVRLVGRQHGGHPVELGQRRAELGLVVGDQAGQLDGQRLRAGQQRVDRGLALAQFGQQQVAVPEQLGELGILAGQRPGDVPGPPQQSGELDVAGGDRLGQRGEPAQRRAGVGRRTGERLGERLQALPELDRVDPGDLLAES